MARGQDVSILLSSNIEQQQVYVALRFSSHEGDALAVFTCFLLRADV